jgi:nicotinate-nucleotide adenylyltransferase
LTLIAKNNRERVGLFGGSFDPVHLGHLAAAEFALSKTKIDRVVFVPVGKPWQKPAPIASAADRMNMLNLSIEANDLFSSSDIEIKTEKTSYMIDTVNEFSELYSGSAISLILGADAAHSLPTWHRYQELIQKVDVVVIAREFQEMPALEFEFEFLPMQLVEVSSSQIRNMVANDENFQELVPKKVHDYIFAHKLYK